MEEQILEGLVNNYELVDKFLASYKENKQNINIFDVYLLDVKNVTNITFNEESDTLKATISVMALTQMQYLTFKFDTEIIVDSYILDLGKRTKLIKEYIMEEFRLSEIYSRNVVQSNIGDYQIRFISGEDAVEQQNEVEALQYLIEEQRKSKKPVKKEDTSLKDSYTTSKKGTQALSKYEPILRMVANSVKEDSKTPVEYSFGSSKGVFHIVLPLNNTAKSQLIINAVEMTLQQVGKKPTILSDLRTNNVSDLGKSLEQHKRFFNKEQIRLYRYLLDSMDLRKKQVPYHVWLDNNKPKRTPKKK